MIQAGRLNKRITLQRKVSSADSYGGEQVSWTNVATIWAAIEPLSGREFFASQQVNAEITTRITIRFLPGVTSAMLVLYGTRTYNILSVIDPREAHVELQLMCSEEGV